MRLGPFASVRGSIADFVHAIRSCAFTPYVIQKELADERFHFYIGDLDASYHYDRPQAWPEMRFLAQQIQVGDWVADVGAHHGVSAMLFARRAGPSGRVMAFEPNAKSASILRKNAEMNSLRNIRVYETAVAHERGVRRFWPNSNAGRLALEGDRRTIDVHTIPLDDVFPNRGPDVIKVDVEGAELEVLEGGARAFANARVWDIELHLDIAGDPLLTVEKVVSLAAARELFAQASIDAPIVPFAVSRRAMSELARGTNVHVFAIAR